MTRDDIIKLAREAGQQHSGTSLVGIQSLERFAALVAAHERAACAAIADAETSPFPPEAPVSQYQSGIFTAAEHIAEAIRARGQA